jgi:ribonuclease P protein component
LGFYHAGFGNCKRELRDSYETSISTVENPPQTAARLPEPQVQQKRPGHSGQSAPCGTQTPYARLKTIRMAAVPSSSLSLPRARRIKQGRDFARARTQGKRAVSGCLIANWVVLPSGSPTRVGVITGRKIGKAVVRTRARRFLREAFRINQVRMSQPVDLVLVARPSIVGKRFVEVQTDFLAALRKAGLLKEAT